MGEVSNKACAMQVRLDHLKGKWGFAVVLGGLAEEEKNKRKENERKKENNYR